MPSFTKIHPVGAELFYRDRWTDRRTDVTKPIVVLHNFTKAPKNLIFINFSLRWRISAHDPKIWKCPNITSGANYFSVYSWIPFSTCLSLDSKTTYIGEFHFLWPENYWQQQLNVSLTNSLALTVLLTSAPFHILPSVPVQHSIRVFLPQLKFVCHYSASEPFSQILATTFYFPYHYSFIFPV